MITYLLTSDKFIGEVEFSYDESNLKLVKFEIQATLTDNQHKAIIERLPLDTFDITRLIRDTNAKLTQIKIELNFDVFWKKYDYKIGNKKRSEKLWNSLNESDRAKVLQFIPKYNAYLASKNNMERCYPETFLSQRRWDV